METKAGYKTSEFWLTFAAILCTMLMAAGVFGEQSTVAKAIEVVAGVLATMGYQYNRASVKKVKPPEPIE